MFRPNIGLHQGFKRVQTSPHFPLCFLRHAWVRVSSPCAPVTCAPTGLQNVLAHVPKTNMVDVILPLQQYYREQFQHHYIARAFIINIKYTAQRNATISIQSFKPGYVMAFRLCIHRLSFWLSSFCLSPLLVLKGI